ncbi:glutamate racemase [Amphritea sp. 2_MG-2023]|uniref:glutamate racemase n=1 Tax=Amphritea TaxID=515417 RepID=UPI001C07B130|nr:glutamate racemase [Amphritea sp. 2_MG-2023]MBU2967319.1 glutamate racemase [Amphritea atlantica]MDO6420467.1 glutamate racemase [Amphritea sp. 2_MG-2023]
MKRPIGIFDSGVGGISIAHSIRRELPSENLLYVADQEFSPYGTKSKQVIENRSESIVKLLNEEGCKAIVVACNTATVNSINKLRKKFAIPLIGIEPAVKPAALQSKTGIIGVLATAQTLNSSSFHLLKGVFSEQVKIETQACPQLVELVENVDLNSAETISVVEGYVRPLLSKGADHIVLGCTHYSFLSPAIEKTVKGKASIIDTAIPVAVELKRRLAELNLLHPQDNLGTIKFWSSSTSKNVSKRISRLWGHDVIVSEIPTYPFDS